MRFITPAWDNRDASSHPSFDPITDSGPSGVPKNESHFVLLSRSSPLIEHCGKCRDVVALAYSALAKLGGGRFEPFVRLSVSSSGHVFAFRLLPQKVARAECPRFRHPFYFR